ncbi:hypothetical protein GY45DRAFT_628049 [Cubamyces sp. BRFM 1775]|nr:hypothetical protein GY45DRAFT_628049 [Cubamyces sp. BRFM 1775]
MHRRGSFVGPRWPRWVQRAGSTFDFDRFVSRQRSDVEKRFQCFPKLQRYLCPMDTVATRVPISLSPDEISRVFQRGPRHRVQ